MAGVALDHDAQRRCLVPDLIAVGQGRDRADANWPADRPRRRERDGAGEDVDLRVVIADLDALRPAQVVSAPPAGPIAQGAAGRSAENVSVWTARSPTLLPCGPRRSTVYFPRTGHRPGPAPPAAVARPPAAPRHHPRRRRRVPPPTPRRPDPARPRSGRMPPRRTPARSAASAPALHPSVGVLHRLRRRALRPATALAARAATINATGSIDDTLRTITYHRSRRWPSTYPFCRRCRPRRTAGTAATGSGCSPSGATAGSAGLGESDRPIIGLPCG